MKIEVPLSVQIASRLMRVREISRLAPGAIIELPKLSDEQLEVVIGSRCIGKGTAVKVGENFGIRITHVGTMKQRIHAMGPLEGEGASLDVAAAAVSDASVAEAPDAVAASSGSDAVATGTDPDEDGISDASDSEATVQPESQDENGGPSGSGQDGFSEGHDSDEA